MTLVYEEDDDTRECNSENAETMEMAKGLKVKARRIKEELEQMGGSLSCFSRGKLNRDLKRNRGTSDDDDLDGGECDKLVRNMIGQRWEALPCPVVMGSGASASAMP